MFSLKPLSVLRMRMSGLVALRLCVATVPGCCVGVTGTGPRAGWALPCARCQTHGHHPEHCQSKGVHSFNVPRISSERWVEFLVI